MKAKQLAVPLAAAVIFLAGMILTEQLLSPPYAVKSAVKLLLILVLTGTGLRLNGVGIKEGIRFQTMKHPAALIAFMIAVIPAVLLGFYLLRNQLDLPAIRQGLMEKEQLTKQNCLFVFAYIALCNSFLEEAFFRGFLTESFRRAGLKKAGAAVSALAFAVYHLGIVDSWLSLPMLLLCIALLFGAALFLQWICDRYESVKASWLVHGCANLAINSVGILLIFFL
ncbi:MAG: CPBP family intramembrane metalloprotease [Oscillospiraceae bacterium]|nr:CPBP family intramembrane metalloprotease [Oscillospiraceae bacterium]